MSHRDDIAAALQTAGIGHWRTAKGKLAMDRDLWISANLVRCANYSGLPTAFAASGMAKPWDGVVDAVHWLAHDRSRHRAPWGHVRVAVPESTSAMARDAVATVARAGNQRKGLVIELATYALVRGQLRVTAMPHSAPDFSRLAKVSQWASMLSRRASMLAKMPQIGHDLARALRSRAPSFRWYRNASECGFSGRVGGLQCCRLEDGNTHVSLGGGRFGAARLADLATAIETIARDRAAPQSAIGSTGLEHLLESGVLRGVVPIDPRHAVLGRVPLAPVAPHEPPLQLPALFGLDDRKRHVDAILRDGEIPWVVELKVASGGQGQYYRHAIAQAILYRDFVRSAAALHPWFRSHGLDATRCQAAIAFPELRGAARITGTIQSTLADTAGSFLVGVAELDPWPTLRTRCMA